MLVPMVLSDRAAAWRIAAVCTITSVLGGLAGYVIGYFFYDVVGARIVDFYGYADKFEDFRGTYESQYQIPSFFKIVDVRYSYISPFLSGKPPLVDEISRKQGGVYQTPAPELRFLAFGTVLGPFYQ